MRRAEATTGCPLGGQQSAMAASAVQMSLRRCGRVLTRSTRCDLTTTRRLSNEAAQGTARPSSASRAISVAMPLTVRVIGAATSLFSTGMASSRVTISTGRRPSGLSAHQTSPCAGATTALRRSSTWCSQPPIAARRESLGCGGMPRRWIHPLGAGGNYRPSLPERTARHRSETVRPRSPPVHRPPPRVLHQCEPSTAPYI